MIPKPLEKWKLSGAIWYCTKIHRLWCKLSTQEWYWAFATMHRMRCTRLQRAWTVNKMQELQKKQTSAGQTCPASNMYPSMLHVWFWKQIYAQYLFGFEFPPSVCWVMCKARARSPTQTFVNCTKASPTDRSAWKKQYFGKATTSQTPTSLSLRFHIERVERWAWSILAVQIHVCMH